MSKRKHDRHDFNEPVRAKCETWKEFLDLYTANISHGGLFVLCEEDLPELDTPLDVEIQMPDHSVLTLRGRVAHVLSDEEASEKGGGAGFGVEFVETSPEQVAALANLIVVAEQHQQDPPPPLPD